MLGRLLTPFFQAVDVWLEDASSLTAALTITAALTLCLAITVVVGVCSWKRASRLHLYARLAVLVGAVAIATHVGSSLYHTVTSACSSFVPDPVLPAGGLHALPSTPAMDHNLLLSFKERGLPVVIRGAVPAAARHAFSLDALVKRFGGETVAYHPQSNVEQGNTSVSTATLSEFVATVKAAGTGGAGVRQPYLAECPSFFDEEYRNHAASVYHEFLTPSADWQEPVSVMSFLWIGPQGARTGLHCDWDPTNILYQMQGTKTVWVFPIGDSSLLYPSQKFDDGATLSRVDPFHPDLAAFPLFRDATPLVAHLAPGDALFIPAGWFHYAESTSLSVSLSGRSYTWCEGLSFLPTLVLRALHVLGMYANGDCTCHPPLP